MKKEDLKAGYVVELRSGELCICSNYKNGLTINDSKGGYCDFNNYDDYFRNAISDDCDIIRIYGLRNEPLFSNSISVCGRPLLWEHDKKENSQVDININEFAAAVHENAVNHGWWEKEPSFPEIIALCHSELSEALECYRKKLPSVYFIDEDTVVGSGIESDLGRYIGQELKGSAVELIDCILRILDYCAAKNIDIEKLLILKNEFNKTRPYKHGGKRI